MSDILIGTSGYDYPEWKGVFYPEKLPRKDFLNFYATRFNALEINSTFYSMPDSTRIQSFIDRSEEKIQFSIKASRLLTHEINGNWQTTASDFRTALLPLVNKNLLSALLFQLPQSFHYTTENRLYLARLLQEFPDFPSVIEFRHKEWIRESVFEGLIKRNASVAFCDMPELKALPTASCKDYNSSLYSQFIGNNAYIRLHGRNENAWYAAEGSNGSSRYDYDYSDQELMQFVPVIITARKENRKVQVYFNNHPKGKGARNAETLKELLKK